MMRSFKILFILIWVLSFTAIPTNANDLINNPALDVDNNTTQSETSIAAHGSTVVIGWNDSGQGPALTSLTGYGFSTDGGTTFTDAGVLAPVPGGLNIGDPAIAVDNAGNFYFATLAFDASYESTIGVARSTSTSPTVTFDTPVLIYGLDPSGTQDKELIAVDKSGGTFDGSVYVVWTEFRPGNNRILFSRSITTTPLTFTTPIIIATSPSPQGAMPVVAPNGDVYVAWEDRLGDISAVIKCRRCTPSSTNQCADLADWDPEVNVTEITRVRDISASSTCNRHAISSNIRINDFPSIAVDSSGGPNHGNLYIVFNADPDGNQTVGDDSDIFFTRSVDGGATWSIQRRINKAPAVTINPDTTHNDNWFPFISVAPGGTIAVIFYDRRLCIDNLDIDLFKAVSTDGGITWFNERVTTQSFGVPTLIPNFDPLIKDCYMGDYNYETADITDFLITWGDNRLKVGTRPDPDIRFFAEPIPSGVDLFITPWGNITGNPPKWQTPDIWVDNNEDTIPDKPFKGIHNKLFARIANLGNAQAIGANIHYSFAPYGLGYSPSPAHFYEFTTQLVNVSQGATIVLPWVDWDLTNLSFDNGGLWPHPVSDFDHFCMKVWIEYVADVNMSNNVAQNNFCHIQTDPGSTSALSFMIANPFLERPVEAELIIEPPLPEGWEMEITDEAGRPLTQRFYLDDGEIKFCKVSFTRPLSDNPRSDVFADIGIKIGEQVMGGISVLLVDVYPCEGVCDGTDTQNIELIPGWNWVSFNVFPNDTSLESFFGDHANLIEQVKTQTRSATNVPGTGWIGDDLNLLSNISKGVMFKIKTKAVTPFTLCVTGMRLPPDMTIELQQNWTWIAYLPHPDCFSVENVVSPILADLYQIKSQTASKTKIGGSLMGDLTDMCPGKGYVVKMNAPGILTYPTPQ